MKRREFLKKAGCGAAGFTVIPMVQASGEEKGELVVPRYDIEVEVVEVGPKTRCHKVGEKFKWPQEMGKLCHWLGSAMDPFLTGLAGGAGTVPFLVGLGYFSDDGFRIDQLFMRDLDEEHAVLHAVRERLKNCEALVSYNGKAYDLNILASRFTLSRMENPVQDLPHLDLLFTVRRLWRLGSPS